MSQVRNILRNALPFIMTGIVMVTFHVDIEASKRLFALLPGEFDWQSFHRFILAHFVHLGWQHLLLNLAGLALVGYLLAGYIRFFEWLAFMLFSAFFISMGLIVFDIDIGISYVGFSGILHGAFLLSAAKSEYLGLPRRILLALVIVGKAFWEQLPEYAAEATEQWIGGKVATGAHALGVSSFFIYWAIVAVIYAVKKSFNKKACLSV